VSESFFEEISRYVRFSDDDRRALSELHDAAKPHFASIAEQTSPQWRDCRNIAEEKVA